MLEGLRFPEKKRTNCKVRSVSLSLEGKDKEIFDAAIANDAWSAVILAKQLRDMGVEISDRTIRTHRLGQCSC